MTDSQSTIIHSKYQKQKPIWVVIPAAGIGQRMQLEFPKQYLKVQGKTILEHTLDCFSNHSQIAGIVCVIDSNDRYWDELNIDFKTVPVRITEGGTNRSSSVMNGLKYLINIEGVSPNDWVMVHDAARPCLMSEDIDKLLSIRDMDCVGGLLATPVRDSMKRTITENNQPTVITSESRENLWHALTPQMFRLGELNQALKKCQTQDFLVNDESSAMEFIGKKPILVEGNPNNIKVTYPNDAVLVDCIKQSDYREESKEL